MRQTASIASVVIGGLFIIGGFATWVFVSLTLSDQQIAVLAGADCLASEDVDGPLSAYCEAEAIEEQLNRLDPDVASRATTELIAASDPFPATEPEQGPSELAAANAFFLRATLLTSVLAFGVAALAALSGLLFILIGLGMRDV